MIWKGYVGGALVFSIARLGTDRALRPIVWGFLSTPFRLVSVFVECGCDVSYKCVTVTLVDNFILLHEDGTEL